VTFSCDEVQALLAELQGRVTELSDGAARHLGGCEACRAAARDEASLHSLLAESLPAEDPGMVASVMAAVGRRHRRRRVLSLVPVAVSGMITAVGVALLGGVPGGSLVALLPIWSRQGWLAVAGMADDWMVAAGATLRTVPAVVPNAVPVVAALLGIATLVGAVGLTRRWRSITPWRRDH